VFGNRVLRRIFRPKREKVAGGCRRLHNEELHKMYASPNIIRVIKSRRMRWVGCVAGMGMMNAWLENLKGRGHSEDLGLDGRIMLEIWWKVVNWIHLTQDRYQWRAFVNTVMYLRDP
jgi:hypothetical protein